jgi:hypothetical protein
MATDGLIGMNSNIDIRPHVQAWLISGCEKMNVLEGSREDVLLLIDDMVEDLWHDKK